MDELSKISCEDYRNVSKLCHPASISVAASPRLGSTCISNYLIAHTLVMVQQHCCSCVCQTGIRGSFHGMCYNLTYGCHSFCLSRLLFVSKVRLAPVDCMGLGRATSSVSSMLRIPT